MIKKNDSADKNGTLNAAEWTKGGLNEYYAFTEVDKDGNNEVNEEELTDFHKNYGKTE